MTNDSLYDIARLHRDRSWIAQNNIGPKEWEPKHDEPKGDVERWWYLQGKAEAFAAIMTEIESSR